MRRISSSIPFLALTLACTDTANVTHFTVRDSAGVRIVENTEAAWQPGEEWRLSPDPFVDIGGGDTDEDQLFQVTAALRLSDGRIVVANAGSAELRFYDENGDYELAAGGRGYGPGEFQYIWQVHRMSGDSLLVYDLGNRRLSVFTQQGEFIRTILLHDAPGGNPQPSGVFSDGQFLIRSAARTSPVPLGRSQVPAILYRAASDGSRFDSVGSSAGTESLRLEASGTQMFIPPPFVRYSREIPHNLSYYTANSERYEFRRYGRDGVLAAIVRRDVPRRRITRADLDAEMDRFLSSFSDGMRRGVESQMSDIEVPEFMPAIGPTNDARRNHVILPDENDNMWVREYEPASGIRQRWSVFDSDGMFLGTLDFPDGVEVFDIGDDYVLGKWEDDLDVEHVLMYELVKPGT